MLKLKFQNAGRYIDPKLVQEPPKPQDPESLRASPVLFHDTREVSSRDPSMSPISLQTPCEYTPAPSLAAFIEAGPPPVQSEAFLQDFVKYYNQVDPHTMDLLLGVSDSHCVFTPQTCLQIVGRQLPLEDPVATEEEVDAFFRGVAEFMELEDKAHPARPLHEIYASD